MTLIDRYPHIIEKSAIVVAHPDDEVLWLSSVLNHADKIIFCFNDYPEEPALGIGRTKAINDYPLTNTVTLNIEEAAVFNKADWDTPNETSFGLEISRDKTAREKYEKNYSKIFQMLSSMLIGFKNVFTHNPWGEYGHEDHVQIYRIIKELQKKMGFDIWHSNYCSNHSMNLMMNHISGFSSNYISLPIDIELAITISDIYKKYGCWTWYKDYKWFKDESLIKDSQSAAKTLPYGHVFPVNFIKIDFTNSTNETSLRNVLHRIMPRSLK